MPNPASPKSTLRARGRAAYNRPEDDRFDGLPQVLLLGDEESFPPTWTGLRPPVVFDIDTHQETDSTDGTRAVVDLGELPVQRELEALGLTEADWDSLPAAERKEVRFAARLRLAIERAVTLTIRGRDRTSATTPELAERALDFLRELSRLGNALEKSGGALRALNVALLVGYVRLERPTVHHELRRVAKRLRGEPNEHRRRRLAAEEADHLTKFFRMLFRAPEYSISESQLMRLVDRGSMGGVRRVLAEVIAHSTGHVLGFDDLKDHAVRKPRR